MKNNNVVLEKSVEFAKQIVNLDKYLRKEMKEYNLSSQIVRSGTSIGANIFEAQDAQSKADFVSKMNIALKEATETCYWLMILHETEYITEKQYDLLNGQVSEIRKLLSSICKTSYEKMMKCTPCQVQF